MCSENGVLSLAHDYICKMTLVSFFFAWSLPDAASPLSPVQSQRAECQLTKWNVFWDRQRGGPNSLWSWVLMVKDKPSPSRWQSFVPPASLAPDCPVTSLKLNQGTIFNYVYIKKKSSISNNTEWKLSCPGHSRFLESVSILWHMSQDQGPGKNPGQVIPQQGLRDATACHFHWRLIKKKTRATVLKCECAARMKTTISF